MERIFFVDLGHLEVVNKFLEQKMVGLNQLPLSLKMLLLMDMQAEIRAIVRMDVIMVAYMPM